MNGISIGYSRLRGKISNRTLEGNSIGFSRTRAFYGTSGFTIGYSRTRGKLENRTLIGSTIGYSRTRGKMLDFRMDGSARGLSTGNVILLNSLPAGLYGISFVLSERQIMSDRVGVQGISFILSDRMPVEEWTGVQGVSAVLSDRQPFNFKFGFNAINIDPPTDEQWFAPQNGMTALDIELDNPTGRGYIIHK